MKCASLHPFIALFWLSEEKQSYIRHQFGKELQMLQALKKISWIAFTAACLPGCKRVYFCLSFCSLVYDIAKTFNPFYCRYIHKPLLALNTRGLDEMFQNFPPRKKDSVKYNVSIDSWYWQLLLILNKILNVCLRAFYAFLLLCVIWFEFESLCVFSK